MKLTIEWLSDTEAIVTVTRRRRKWWLFGPVVDVTWRYQSTYPWRWRNLDTGRDTSDNLAVALFLLWRRERLKRAASDNPPQFKAGQSVNITGGEESAEYVRKLRGDSDESTPSNEDPT